jgi:hypothetical protein
MPQPRGAADAAGSVQGEPVSRQLPLLVRDQVVVIGGDAVPGLDVVQEPLQCRLEPRIARVDEELSTSGVISGRQLTAGRQRLVAELEHLPRPVVVTGDPGRCRPHLIEHLLLAHPAVEPVHLKVERDIRVKRVIPDGNRLMISSSVTGICMSLLRQYCYRAIVTPGGRGANLQTGQHRWPVGTGRAG